MPLTKSQQKIIKQYSSQLSPKEIAEELKVPEREIVRYLKKKMRPDKLKKMMSKFAPKAMVDDFSLKIFFQENYLFFTLLAFLVIVSYANSLGNTFVSDDIGGISTNPNIGNFSNIFSSFRGFFQNLTYFIIYKIFGLVPAYYRATNILFHLGTTFLIYLILSIMNNKKLGIITASLFAVHPILAESISWISGHPYAASSFFFLLSFFLYLLGQKNKLYFIASVIAFAISLSYSDKGFVLFIIFPLYEWFFGKLKDNWKKIIPFFATSSVVAIIALNLVGYRVSVLQSDFYLTPGKDSLFIKIPTSVATYFGLIFWPDKLSLYHTEMVFSNAEYLLTVFIFAVYLAAIIFFYFKDKMVSFWLLFFLIPLSPTLSPLRIAWAVAERYAYLSVIGILFLIAWIFYKVSEKEKFRMATYIVFWIIISLLSVRTIVRNTDWKSEESLWISTAKTSPSGPNIHNNLGDIYNRKGEKEKAIEEFKKAIEINPKYADAYHNLGNVYYELQQYDEAEASYQQALNLNLKLWQSHQNLAALYYARGKFAEAKAELEEAKRLNPNEPSIQQNLDLVNQALQ